MKTFFREAVEKVGLLSCDYGVRITVYGFRGVSVSGHSGVMDFSPEKIVVKIKKKKMIVSGCRMCIREISSDELYIAGVISGITEEDAR